MSDTLTRTRTSPLRIHPAPFKPTLLSIPPSPFSPRLPITPASPPIRRSPFQHSTTIATPQPTSTAPSSPLSWMWQCHQCQRNYHLGATRRCLDDGHTFCSGSTTVQAWRKQTSRRVKKHRACASEFDYAGWKAWGRWRRGGPKTSLCGKGVGGEGKGRGVTVNVKGDRKDCWNTCDYPSECRWGRRFGIHTPLTETFPSPTSTTAAPPLSQNSKQGILPPSTSPDSNKPDLWTCLLASAKTRKIIPPASPLSFSETTNSDSATVGSVAIDMLKDLMKRKTSRRGGLKRQSSYPVPLSTVSKSVVMKDGEEIGVASPESMVDVDVDVDMDDEGFAPLERVKGRGEMMDVDDV